MGVVSKVNNLVMHRFMDDKWGNGKKVENFLKETLGNTCIITENTLERLDSFNEMVNNSDSSWYFDNLRFIHKAEWELSKGNIVTVEFY